MKIEEFTDDPLKFASLIAHQLQSPLSAVLQALQTVLGDYMGPLLPGQRGSLEKASERCTQAVTAVRRMLAILEAQQREQPPVPAALSAVIRLAYADYAEQASRRNVDFHLDLEAEDRSVGIGEPALAEVVSALLENALKYTPEGGSIYIASMKSERDGFVRLAVGDSGIGVPAELREKIFEPFYRAPGAKESTRPGVGLGLAFVSSVVESVGGSASVARSRLGGAEFRLELPLSEGAPDADTATATPGVFKVLIIGGVAAGSKAASKAVRLRPDADVTVVDRGSVLAYAGCGLPYYVSGIVRNYRRLISSPAGVSRDPVFFQNVKHVHVRNHTEAIAIDRAARKVRVRDLFTGRESLLSYDRLLLATGASAVVPEKLRVARGNVFTLHGVRDAEGIKGMLADGRARDVVIVGGGLLGIEMTESLMSKGCRVSIVEACDQILPVLDPDMARLVAGHMASRGVKIYMNTRVESFAGADSVSEVVLDNGARLPADMVILAIGVRPNIDLALAAGLEIGETGAIRVDARMATSDPDIYAAGDCVESVNRITGRPCYMPLGATANKQARVAAINMCGGEDSFPGVLASCICKIFDYCAARTGLSEGEARRLGYDVVTALVPGPDREHYMPAMGLLLLKLVVDRSTRRLLGLQATGPGAADKRVDVAAMAITAGMTVDDIANADLCYAPSYSSAMDNIITAANVARNKLDGVMHGISPDEVRAMQQRREDFALVDVRTPDEYARIHIPGSTLIPLGTLRERLAALPREREIVTFCDISLRGYEASLILRAAGFERVRVMEGGIAMWPYETVE